MTALTRHPAGDLPRPPFPKQFGSAGQTSPRTAERPWTIMIYQSIFGGKKMELATPNLSGINRTNGCAKAMFLMHGCFYLSIRVA